MLDIAIPAFDAICDSTFTNFDQSTYAYLLAHARWYVDSTPAVERGRPGVCFCNSLNVALTLRLTYVEGLARVPRTNLWMHHAWCVDDQERVIDPTWATEGLASYYGVPIDLRTTPGRMRIPKGHVPIQHGFLPCLALFEQRKRKGDKTN